jgi:O-antigen/teichoic acid export membrane protein
MKRTFLINLFLFLGLNLLIKPLWIFGIDRTVQNTVGEYNYGIYFALFNFSMIFSMLLDLGITNFNNRSIARSNDFLQEGFSRIFTLRLLLGLLYILFVLAAGWFVGYDVYQYKLLIPLVINQFLAGFILYLRSNISGLLMFKTDSLLSVSDRIIMIICCGVLLWGNVTDTPFQIEWFIYVQTFAYLFTILLALPVVLKKTKLKSPYIDYAYFKYILRQSLPFALLVLLTNLHNRTDAIFLERLLPDGLGAEQAGIYASAFRLLDAALIVAYVFSVLLLPMFARMIAEKTSVNSLVKTSFTLIFIYGVLLATVSYYYSYPLMEVLYQKHVWESSDVFSILMLSIAPLSATYIFGTLLTANGDIRKLNIIALIAMVLNIGMNILLIPKYLAVGSAVASVCTQLFIITVEIILAVKTFSLKITKGYLIRMLCFLFFTVIAGWFSVKLPFDWKVNFAVMICLCVCFVFVFGLVKVKEVGLLVRK